MKKTLAILPVVIFILLAFTQGVFAADFPDVRYTHKNYDAIMHLTELGVIAGYEDGTFCPEKEITRTEFCALMARTLGYNKDTYEAGEIPFDDVPEDYWGRAYISYCYELGLINGMEEGVFAPADKVTVAQIAKMSVCAVGKEDEALEIVGKKWYSGYMDVADFYGLLDETDQEPDEKAVRANVAQVVYNMITADITDESEDDDMPEILDIDDIEKDEDEDSEESTICDEEIVEAFMAKDYSDVKVILVDAGHNYDGKDTGARYEPYNAVEEVITWQIAEKLRINLEDMGYKVVMTRKKVTDSIGNTSAVDSLQARVDMAHTSLADLYIAVHCNMGGGTGTETYCFSESGYSARLAELVQEKITKETGLFDRGVKTSKFFVIKNTLMPTILVETAFMDTQRDALLLTTEYGQECFARAIADAVYEYDMMEPLKIEKENTEQTEKKDGKGNKTEVNYND